MIASRRLFEYCSIIISKAFEAILFLEQTGDLRFKERIYQGETYRFSLMENDGRRILKVTDSRGAILIGQ